MASPSEEIPVEDFAHGLSSARLRCRELGHYWKPLTATWDREARCFDRSLRCTGCRTIRHQTLTESGHVVANRYTYPEGYLAKGVAKHGGSRDAFRAESLRRFVESLPSN